MKNRTRRAATESRQESDRTPLQRLAAAVIAQAATDWCFGNRQIQGEANEFFFSSRRRSSRLARAPKIKSADEPPPGPFDLDGQLISPEHASDIQCEDGWLEPGEQYVKDPMHQTFRRDREFWFAAARLTLPNPATLKRKLRAHQENQMCVAAVDPGSAAIDAS